MRADAALIALLPVEMGNGSARTGVADVVAWVSLSDPLIWALASTAAAWSATAVDPRRGHEEHALLSPPKRRCNARVELMSVGLSGLGDPDWDLVTEPDWDLVTEYDWILRSGLPPLPYATAVLHAYALADGPGRLRRDALAVRMILTSLRLAAAASCSTPSAGTNTWGALRWSTSSTLNGSPSLVFWVHAPTTERSDRLRPACPQARVSGRVS